MGITDSTRIQTTIVNANLRLESFFLTNTTFDAHGLEDSRMKPVVCYTTNTIIAQFFSGEFHDQLDQTLLRDHIEQIIYIN